MEMEVAANVELPNDEPVDLDRTVEEIPPYSKAAPRKPTNRGRKARKTAILTDPETMEALRAEQKASTEKIKTKLRRGMREKERK